MNRKRSSVEVVANDVFHELSEENERLLNELLFANKCLKKLIEFKNYFSLYSNKIKQCLDSNEWQSFEKVCEDYSKMIAQRSRFTKTNGQKSRTKNKNIRNSCFEILESDSNISRNISLFVCPEIGCNESFNTKNELNLHQKNVHLIIDPRQLKLEKSKKKCRNCEFKTSDKKRMKSHLYRCRYLLSKKFRCQRFNCQYSAHSKQELESHVQTKHITQSEQSVVDEEEDNISETEEEINPDMLHCQYSRCSFETLNAEELETHVKSHEQKLITCFVRNCEFIGNNHKEFRLHLESHKTLKTFVCEWPGCQFQTKCKFRFKNHGIKHSNVYIHKCTFDGCDKVFKTKSQRTTHINIVHLKRHKFLCEWPGCDFRTDGKMKLEVHQTVHTGERKYECDREGCAKKFKTLQVLEKHKVTVHDKIKKYSCSWPGCTQKFCILAHLKRHELIHSGDKPFKCEWPGCEYRTNSKTNLKYQHMKKHNIYEKN